MEKVMLIKTVHYTETGSVLKIKKYVAEKINKYGETLFAFVDSGKRDFVKQKRLEKNFKTDSLTYCVWSVEKTS